MTLIYLYMQEKETEGNKQYVNLKITALKVCLFLSLYNTF